MINALFNSLRSWFDRRRRRTDMNILWPICLEQAGDLAAAKAIFYYHIANDPAWTRYYTREQLVDFMKDLNAKL